jgi:hypothetical protein
MPFNLTIQAAQFGGVLHVWASATNVARQKYFTNPFPHAPSLDAILYLSHETS